MFIIASLQSGLKELHLNRSFPKVCLRANNKPLFCNLHRGS